MIRQLQNAGPTLKIILGAMLVIICASMAITLIPGGIGSSLGIGAPPAGVLATIGDQTVTVPEVQREAKAMIRQQFPRGGPQASMLMPYFASQAAQQLINEKALVAEAHHMGLRVSDDELRDELQHGQLGAMLFPDGKFVGQEEYENFVQRNDMTVPQFESLEKDFILVRKLRALVSTSAFVGDAEVHDEFNHRNTKVKFEYAVLTQADILKGLHPTDGELKAYYERSKANYNNSIPEKRQIKYVVVDSAKIAAATTVADSDLQAYYDQHRDEYRVAEQVKVSHILIKTPLPAPGAKEDEKAIAVARAKAEGVLKEVKAGGDFAKLAEKYSEDTTAKNGGELGWIGRGRTVPEFEKAAFSLGKGQTSDLVKSSYGFHIIHVEDKQAAHLKTLAEVKSEIEEKVKQQKTSHATEAAANALLSHTRTDGFDAAAAAKGQPAVTTEFFGRTDNLPGLGANPQFMDAVFNEAEKAPPDVVQVPQGYVVFQVLAVKPPATPTFEDIRSREKSCQGSGCGGEDQRPGSARRAGSRHRLDGGRERDFLTEARRDKRSDHSGGQWCSRAASGKTGADRPGICREERRDPAVAAGIQAERLVRAVRYEPAQGHGKVQPAQGQSGRNEKPDPPRWAGRFVVKKFSVLSRCCELVTTR